MQEIFYVYRYFDPSRNEYIYIGKGKGTRHLQHLAAMNKKDTRPFIRRLEAMKREGADPVIDFIVEDTDEELAFLVEQEAIAKYGRRDLGTGTLWNMTAGGEGSAKPSPETLRKRSNSQKATFALPEVKARLSAAMKLYCASDEACHQKSTAMLKAFSSPEHRARQSAAIKAWWARRKAAQHTMGDQQ
jgi:hypothetical protein